MERPSDTNTGNILMTDSPISIPWSIACTVFLCVLMATFVIVTGWGGWAGVVPGIVIGMVGMQLLKPLWWRE